MTSRLSNSKPKNPEDSFQELTGYQSFYVSGHSAFVNSAEKKFIKIPDNIIVVALFNNYDVTNSDDIFFLSSLANKEHYLQHMILTENADHDEYDKLRNKTIFMGGSCITNFDISFESYPDDPIVYGIFDVDKDIYNNSELKTIEYNPYSLRDKTNIMNKFSLPITTRDMTLEYIFNDYFSDNYQKIIYIDICTPITDDRFNDFKDINFGYYLEKNNMKCILDSLQRFTSKFSFYDKPKFNYYGTKLKTRKNNMLKARNKSYIDRTNNFLSKLSESSGVNKKSSQKKKSSPKKKLSPKKKSSPRKLTIKFKINGSSGSSAKPMTSSGLINRSRHTSASSRYKDIANQINTILNPIIKKTRKRKRNSSSKKTIPIKSSRLTQPKRKLRSGKLY